jgi:CheY-like chemotaxis protein
MALRLDADRWGDLEVLEVSTLDLSGTAVPDDASWWCGRCGDDHGLLAGAVVRLRSHLGVVDQIACPRCAEVARRRLEGPRPRRVLLIEDDPDHRDLTRRVLEDEASAEVVGYVSDGAQALVEIDRLRPDLLVLDLGMPRVDGLELLERLPADLEVVVLTGVPALADRCRARHAEVTVLRKGTAGLDQLRELVRAS